MPCLDWQALDRHKAGSVSLSFGARYYLEGFTISLTLDRHFWFRAVVELAQGTRQICVTQILSQAWFFLVSFFTLSLNRVAQGLVSILVEFF